MNLYDLFKTAIPCFEYYGLTEVTTKEWQALLILSHKYGGIKKKVISELK
jgi:hypothetical protein